MNENTTFNNDTDVIFNGQKPMSDSDFSNVKILGGLAALFVLGGIIPYLGSLLSIASIVMFLIVFYKISRLTGEKSIFNNILMSYLIAFAFGIGIVVYFVFLFMDIFKAYGDVGIYFFEDPDNIEMLVSSFLTELVVVFVFAYVVMILFAFLWKKSLDKTAAFFNEKLFKTAGLLYIIGAPTIIVCGLGFLVTLAGHIVLAVAFFSLKKTEQQNSLPQQ